MNIFLKEKNDVLKNSLYLRKLKTNIMTTQVYSHNIESRKLGGTFFRIL